MNWEDPKLYVNSLVGTADKVSQKTEIDKIDKYRIPKESPTRLK
jgi:hypothetical protein